MTMKAPADEAHSQQLLDWCASVLGPVRVVSNCTKSHPGMPATTCRLSAATGYCYLKTHRSASSWESEVHAYERWASAFGPSVPKLLAVRDDEPRAILINELPGQCFENVRPLSPSLARGVWRAAGQALAPFHDLAAGGFFGSCRRDGRPVGEPVLDAVQYVSAQISRAKDRAVRMGYLNDGEIAIVRTALELVSVFDGEFPVPCHRDYCPANWLVTEDGEWVGTVDFEFSCWDVRAADFTRYPDWNWIARPDLTEAFFEGYGRSFTHREEQQRLVAHVQYALSAVVWGRDNGYFGFADEGRKALGHLSNSGPW